MYSRKFSGNNPELPPDYGGSALRRGMQEEKREQTISQNSPRSADYREVPDDAQHRQDKSEREKAAPVYGRTYGINGNIPHRPVYRSREKFQELPEKTERTEKKEKESVKKSGLFGLSSLNKKNFSIEDIVLAGLILLLINDDSDQDILLILGFLLLVGL